MSVYEETQLLRHLTAAVSATNHHVPTSVRRLLCKLRLRSESRQQGLPTFSLVPSLQQGPRILDRYQHSSDIWRLQNTGTDILPHVDPICFTSPYTNRLLKPYIRRDVETCPRWLSLQSELRNAVEAISPHLAPLPPTNAHPLDYCYVRPHHIPALNALASTAFWPGIDLSECLAYPEFSCVVSFKRLVVGFAFMVPDIGFNEAYISFVYTRPHWRGCGIATFMLYHLIQTCLGKDVTLHVSVTNPALLLYQKFGFKVEELVQDFYDKYLPASSKECKHALSLRLCR